MERNIIRSLPFMSGHCLASWLNHKKDGIEPDQASVATYIRWANSRRGALPDAAQTLFIDPIRVRLRHAPRNVVDLEGCADRDQALMLLADISRAGLLNRMRECPRCRQWYFAIDQRQKFCSPNCRTGHFATHGGRERAGLRNRAWRIENIHLPAVGERIRKLRKLPVSKSIGKRVELALRRQAVLVSELSEIRERLDHVLSKESGSPEGNRRHPSHP